MRVGFGVLAIFVGILSMIFRTAAARYIVRSQNQFWKFRMGAQAQRSAATVLLLVGLILLAVGSASLIAG